MKIILYKIVFLMGLATGCFAQNTDPIQTDRPDQTECPFITPTHFLQFEIGFPYEKTNTHSTKMSLPTMLSKFGINERFELRLITEHLITSEITNENSGFTPIAIGFKSQLLKERGILPTLAVIGHFHLPKVASTIFQTPYSAPAFRFTMQHTLTPNQTLSYNIGAEWDGDTGIPTFIYTLTTAYSFSEKTSGYIELYGFLPQRDLGNHRLDGGFNYLWNPNHQLDISAGIGLTENAPKYFVALGYSFRFKI